MRQMIYDFAGGRCQECGDDLLPGWHADHEIPFSADGPTDLSNAQALCRECNELKGARNGARSL
jgi:5-methylcytosine-specific restriction endonuclease McrA